MAVVGCDTQHILVQLSSDVTLSAHLCVAAVERNTQHTHIMWLSSDVTLSTHGRVAVEGDAASLYGDRTVNGSHDANCITP